MFDTVTTADFVPTCDECWGAQAPCEDHGGQDWLSQILSDARD